MERYPLELQLQFLEILQEVELLLQKIIEVRVLASGIQNSVLPHVVIPQGVEHFLSIGRLQLIRRSHSMTDVD